MKKTGGIFIKTRLAAASFLAVILLAVFLFSISFVYAGTLSCTVTTAAACTGTVIYRMSGTTNAHLELPSQSTVAYNSNVVCCSGVTGLSNACASPQAKVLNLTANTNSHASQTATSPYITPACISVPIGGTVSVGYQATNCTGFDTTLGSMSGTDNAHIGNTTAYTTKICATAVGVPATTFLVGGTETGTKNTSVATITFPQGAPGATISAPYNNVDGSGEPQVLSATVSEPVVKIKNTHGSQSYNIVLEITTWTNNIVNMEYYNLATDGATNIQVVTDELSNANGATRTVSTGVSITAGAYKDLYLKLVLSDVAGKTGTSTLAVLGETP